MLSCFFSFFHSFFFIITIHLCVEMKLFLAVVIQEWYLAPLTVSESCERKSEREREIEKEMKNLRFIYNKYNNNKRNKRKYVSMKTRITKYDVIVVMMTTTSSTQTCAVTETDVKSRKARTNTFSFRFINFSSFFFTVLFAFLEFHFGGCKNIQ